MAGQASLAGAGWSRLEPAAAGALHRFVGDEPVPAQVRMALLLVDAGGMAAFQSFLVACKLPNRRAGEIIRAILFIPGEIYLWRSLAVWVGSVLKTAADIRGNLWQAQYHAEAANKTRSVSALMTIILTITVPVVCLNLLAGFISGHHMDVVLTVLWWTLTIMTGLSVVSMATWTFRILRRFRTLHP